MIGQGRISVAFTGLLTCVQLDLYGRCAVVRRLERLAGRKCRVGLSCLGHCRCQSAAASQLLPVRVSCCCDARGTTDTAVWLAGRQAAGYEKDLS